MALIKQLTRKTSLWSGAVLREKPEIMTLDEIEMTIVTWPDPWPELLASYQRLRNYKLDHALSDEDRRNATEEYKSCLFKIIESNEAQGLKERRYGARLRDMDR